MPITRQQVIQELQSYRNFTSVYLQRLEICSRRFLIKQLRIYRRNERIGALYMNVPDVLQSIILSFFSLKDLINFSITCKQNKTNEKISYSIAKLYQNKINNNLNLPILHFFSKSNYDWTPNYNGEHYKKLTQGGYIGIFSRYVSYDPKQRQIKNNKHKIQRQKHGHTRLNKRH